MSADKASVLEGNAGIARGDLNRDSFRRKMEAAIKQAQRAEHGIVLREVVQPLETLSNRLDTIDPQLLEAELLRLYDKMLELMIIDDHEKRTSATVTVNAADARNVLHGLLKEMGIEPPQGRVEEIKEKLTKEGKLK